MAPPHRSQRYSMPPPEEYFRGVSPLCRRILEDMARIRESYGESWNGLSYQEQCKILDQTIVDEATVRRYESAGFPGPDCEYFPKLKLSTGQKIVSDEKLSARGYSCSWRDEHSAPFSWHTRSQMDLTLDTPPDTPLQNSTPITDDGSEPGGPSKSGNAWNTLRIPPKPGKPPPFLWHYTPQPDLKPPDPPDLVLASMARDDAKGASPMLPRGMNFNHVVVRAPEVESDSSSFFGWFRGAITAITSTCIPLHSCGSTSRGILHPGSPFIHPELRPPHVIAKAAKISLPMMAQPKRPKQTESEESIFRMPHDATLKSECPSTETETTFTTDVASDRGSHAPSEDDKVSKRDSQNMNRSILSNRNSLMYGTFAEEEEETSRKRQANEGESRTRDQVKNERSIDNDARTRDEENNQSRDGIHNFSLTTRSDVSESYEMDEELPLINLATNTQTFIPKTGFDFLDNW